MGNPSPEHLKQVNSSGLLYQMKIAHEIQSTARNHGWEFKCSEYRWIDPSTGEEEFIDLILKSGAIEIIAECKRVSGGAWVFPVPNSSDKTGRMRLLWSVKVDESRGISSWDDVGFHPPTHESSLCILPGQNERDKPMLERIASKLVRSVEVLSQEEYSFPRSPLAIRQLRVYIPIIITNAQLKICHFDPKKVDLSSGLLSEGEFEDVPFVRFRKTLSTSIKPRMKHLIDIAEFNEKIERTVMIVNGSEIVKFLTTSENRIFIHDEFSGYPWSDPINGLIRDE
ncbi:hypothetical protein TFLX_03123 [Thermoflexales bacterium]|nr:hypothetical protein TFLX_03123 [Thermoflexales bacterium]